MNGFRRSIINWQLFSLFLWVIGITFFSCDISYAITKKNNLLVTEPQNYKNISSIITVKQPTIIYLAHGAKLGHPTDLMAQEVAEQFNKLTQGRVLLKVYGEMKFGQESDLVSMVQKGKLDLAIVSTGPLASYYHSISVLDLPYLFNSSDEAYSAWDGEPGKLILTGLKSVNIDGICYWDNGLRSLTTRNSPVCVPNDFNGMKLRVMQNPIFLSFFQRLGAKPTPLSWGEVIPSLKAGIIEAQENPIPIIYLNHLEQFQHYLILTRHCYNPHIVIASQALKQKLSSVDLGLLYGLIKNARNQQRYLINEQSIEYVKLLKANGMSIIEPDLNQFKIVGKEFSRQAITGFDAEVRFFFERYLQ